jgi:hypothetical protein
MNTERWRAFERVNMKYWEKKLSSATLSCTGKARGTEEAAKLSVTLLFLNDLLTVFLI